MKTIVDSNGLLQLNEKYIEELDHKTLPLTTAKYFSGQKKHRHELSDKSKTQST